MSDTNDLNKTHAEVSYMSDDEIIELARKISLKRLAQGPVLNSPQAANKYLQAIFAAHTSEVFGVVYLDTKHKVLAFREHFFGSLAVSAVYSREIVKAAIAYNAGAIICTHNHPSGVEEASEADVQITHHLRDAMNLIDVRLLDHIIVTPGKCYSLVEEGKI